MKTENDCPARERKCQRLEYIGRAFVIGSMVLLAIAANFIFH